jgi:hypothetical protein
MIRSAHPHRLALRLLTIAWLALLQGLLPLLHGHPGGTRAADHDRPAGLHLPDRQALADPARDESRPLPTVTAQDDRSRLVDSPPVALLPGHAGLLIRSARDAACLSARDEPAALHTQPRACAGPPRGPPAAA